MKTKSDKTGFWPLKAVALVLVLFFLQQSALAEVMDQFRAEIVLKKDASADVTESISMDFGSESRHGIRRHIPVAYRRFNAPYTVDLAVQSVTSQNGQPLPYSLTRSGSEIILKIGDANHTVQGKQTYKIHYLAKRIINWFDNEPEFYWNVTGTETPFPISKSEAIVNLPAGLASKDVKVLSFQGLQGSTTAARVQLQESQVIVTSGKLNPDEGLTFAIRMPPSAMKRPTAIDESVFWLKDWSAAVLIPLFAFAVLYVRWCVKGKDEGVTNVAGVDWEPPKGLSPAEVGTLVDEKCDVQDVTSTLIDLAARGYLKIKKTTFKKFVFLSDKGYEFTRLEPPPNSPPLLPHEQRFLDGIFASCVGTQNVPGQVVQASMLKYVFYPYFAEIKNLIYRRLVDQQLFFGDPETIRHNFYAISLVLAFGACLSFIYSAPVSCGLLVAAVLAALFAPAMPGRTKEGAELTRQALGFQRFVKMAEKDRIKVLAAEDPTIFGRLLPYAMVLGAADQWAEAFKDIALPCPDWYQSDQYSDNYSTTIFINDLGNSLGWFNQTFTTPPPTQYVSDGNSGGGGGFSGFDGGSVGGGFGGGGTDSW
ncbi:MAG: DUF2207 domain-containing protein [Candidatus Obscuribacterales bacterium]|nr:DUF2207 domain-containing protein [Candidatus Obscuribacterales bacterium]